MKSKIIVDKIKGCVIKQCRNKAEFDRELEVYSLQLDFIPELLEIKDNYVLEIAYIDGVTIAPDSPESYSEIAEIYAKLHLATIKGEKVICHLDNNPANYIKEKSSGRYHMIDFSESGYSYPENDLVNFLLFRAPYFEPNEYEKYFSPFLSSYQAINLIEMKHKGLIYDWIDIFDERRRKYCKSRCVNTEWQKVNRDMILKNFYSTILRSYDEN